MVERNLETSSSTCVISANKGEDCEDMRVPQFRVRARERESRWIMGRGSIGVRPALP